MLILYDREIDGALTEFTYGRDMLTLINEQFKPGFIHIVHTFASRANYN